MKLTVLSANDVTFLQSLLPEDKVRAKSMVSCAGHAGLPVRGENSRVGLF